MKNEMFDFYKSALQGSITAPLCADYKNEWRKCGDDKEKLFRLVLKQQSLPFYLSHCYQGKGLSKKYVMDEFDSFINGKYTGEDVDGVEGGFTTQLYAGYEHGLKPSLDVMAFQWCNIPLLTVPTCKATKIYAACNSTINIACEGFNSLIIMLFDESVVNLQEVDAESIVTIYKYSDNAVINIGKHCLSEKINIHNKELRL